MNSTESKCLIAKKAEKGEYEIGYLEKGLKSKLTKAIGCSVTLLFAHDILYGMVQCM